MPSTRLKTTKEGKEYYEIRVSRGRDKSQLSTRWYVPDGWSKRAIEKELAAVAAEFERKAQSGEILSRTEKAAQAEAAAQEEAKILTFRQYGEKVFMPYKALTVAETTRSNYQNFLDLHIYPTLGDLKITEITPAQITEMLASLQSNRLSHSTIKVLHALLSTLFKMAYLNDMIEKNPMDKVSIPKAKKDKLPYVKSNAYSSEEIISLMNIMKSTPLKWQVFVSLLLNTGIRCGECCALQWKKINFETGEILIDANVCYTPSKGVYLSTPKSGRSRTVYTGNETLKLLKRLRAEQSKKAISRFIFPTQDNSGPMNTRTANVYLSSLSKKYGIKDLHPHKLRHTFASIAIMNGADIASVSEALGHADKSMTLRIYTHTNQESINRVGQIFRDALKLAE